MGQVQPFTDYSSHVSTVPRYPTDEEPESIPNVVTLQGDHYLDKPNDERRYKRKTHKKDRYSHNELSKDSQGTTARHTTRGDVHFPEMDDPVPCVNFKGRRKNGNDGKYLDAEYSARQVYQGKMFH